jgi:hypothetical protein
MRLTVTKIVKRWEGKRKPGKKEHRWAATTYTFPSEFAAQQAFWSIREHQPKKELNRFGKDIIVQP